VYWVDGVAVGSFRVEFSGYVAFISKFGSSSDFSRPALEISGLSCVIVVVSCIGDCIRHMSAAISCNSWMIVMTCYAAKSILCVVAVLSVSRVLSV